MTLGRTIPALPVHDVAAAVTFYGGKLGFHVLHHDGGFAVLRRDDAVLHLWESGDESWQTRTGDGSPVCSGAESFIAGTASCRIEVTDVDALYEEMKAAGVLHPVSRSGVDDTDFGTREFSVLDQDGNLIGFHLWTS
jgi:catechol 2,3-dioxygenase-like lactoylglutathione lyase family enzyme